MRSVSFSMMVVAAASMMAPVAMAQGTQEQRDACQPDSAKFCQEVGTEEAAIGQCLGKNFRKLSPGCRQVMRFATIQKVCAQQISASCASAGDQSGQVVACLGKTPRLPSTCRNAVRAYGR